MRDPAKLVARKPRRGCAHAMPRRSGRADGAVSDRSGCTSATGRGMNMAKAAPEGLITALDIGSSKVSAMIAQKGDGGELIVLGTGQRESRGVKRGYIADMAATEAAVREAVEQAERIAGHQHRERLGRLFGGRAGQRRRRGRGRAGRAPRRAGATSTRCSRPGATRSIRRGGWCCTRSPRSTRSTG